MIFFSVVIPVYNTGHYLQRCFDSVLSQTYENWEAIVVDDGSTDNYTIQICDNYARKDQRFHVIHKENEGSLLARRKAIEEAKGDFFCFLDSDDYWNKNLLSKVNDCIQTTGSDLVIYRFQRKGTRRNAASPKIFKNKTIITEKTKYRLLKPLIRVSKLNNLCLKVVSRDIVDIGRDYTPYKEIQYGEDLLQSIPFLENAKRITFINDILYYYYNNPTSMTRVPVSDEKHYKLYMNSTIVKKVLLSYLERNFNREEYIDEFYLDLIKQRFLFVKDYSFFQEDKILFQKYADMVLNDDLMRDAGDFFKQSRYYLKNRKIIKLLKSDQLYQYAMNKLYKG